MRRLSDVPLYLESKCLSKRSIAGFRSAHNFVRACSSVKKADAHILIFSNFIPLHEFIVIDIAVADRTETLLPNTTAVRGLVIMPFQGIFLNQGNIRGSPTMPGEFRFA